MTEIAIFFLIVAALIVYVPRVFFLALGLAGLVAIWFLLGPPSWQTCAHFGPVGLGNNCTWAAPKFVPLPADAKLDDEPRRR
jgi:hypothetical protein